jgi:hypothetical protein
MKNSTLLLAIVISFMFLISCSNLKQKNLPMLDKIKSRSWEGKIYRSRDDKELSDIRLKIVNNSMYIFSNAIFGADNDTLTLLSNNNQDSTCIFTNTLGNQFNIKYALGNGADSTKLKLIGSNFYMLLVTSSMDIYSSNVNDSYLNIVVPRDPDMYLDGGYEGTVEFENPLVNMFSSSVGSAKIKLVFLTNFKVKMYANVLLNNSSEILPYKMKGDKIFIGTSKQKGGKLYEEGLKIVNKGSKLVYQGDDMNLILSKIY